MSTTTVLETVYSPFDSDEWHLTCHICLRPVFSGEFAAITEDSLGNYVRTTCSDHLPVWA